MGYHVPSGPVLGGSYAGLPRGLFLDQTASLQSDPEHRNECIQPSPSTLTNLPDVMMAAVGVLPESIQIAEENGRIVVSLLAVYDPGLVTLPASIQEGGLIDVVPVLFTQGINEMQTVSNLMRKAGIQQDINEVSLKRLQRYVRKYLSVRSGWPNYDWGASVEDIYALLSSVSRTVSLGKTSKSTGLLQKAADLVRLLGGGRVTCCKSAKDRTSMSSTLENARILSTVAHVSDTRASASLMRYYGVRRTNAMLNSGSGSYAFNFVQRAFLPRAYKPPKGSTASSVVT